MRPFFACGLRELNADGSVSAMKISRAVAHQSLSLHGFDAHLKNILVECALAHGAARMKRG